ncbi:MAG: secondary thiamine-phosphate synthase enzyme YjbQ [Myxococcota bacterium]
MSVSHQRFAVATRGRGFHDLTGLVEGAVHKAGGAALGSALCHVFLEHTSASLIFCENADPTVQADLERFAARLAPDGSPEWRHSAEGPDDMPAHVRAVLTLASVTIPVTDGRLGLGTWQGLYLWEHRLEPHRRWVTVSLWT